MVGFKLIAGTLLILLSRPQTAIAKNGYTLAQLEEMLWGTNPSVEAAFYRLKTALYKEEEASHLFRSQLVINTAFYPSGRTSADRPYLSDTRRGTVSVYFPIIKGLIGRYYTSAERRAQSREMEAGLAQTKNEALLALRQKYFQTITAHQLSQIYNKASLGLKEILQEIRQRYRHKQVLLSDVLFAEKKLLQFKQKMTRQQNKYLEQKAALAILLGMDEEELLLAPDPSFRIPSLPRLGIIKKLAFENSPLLRILKTRLEAEQAKADRAYWDNVNLQVAMGYSVEQEQNAGTDRGSYLGLNMSIPLKYWQISSLRKQQALSEQKIWQAELNLAKRELRNEITLCYQQVKTLQAEYLFLEKQKQEAKIRRRQLKRKKNYSLPHKVDYRQLVQAEADFWEAEIQLTAKNWERFMAFYRILYLSGFTKDLPAAFLTPGPSSLAFQPGRICMRTLLIENSSFISNAAEREFFLFFCQTKGIGRVLLPINCLNESGVKELLSQLFENKINSFVFSKMSDKQTPLQCLKKVIEFNEKNEWEANWRGIYLIADFGEEAGFLSLLEGVNKKLLNSAQELRLILQVPAVLNDIDPGFWRQVIDIAGELAFAGSTDNKLPSSLETIFQQKNKAYWWVFTTKDFNSAGEQEMETKIQQLAKKDSLTLGVVLDNYHNYRHLITH